MKHRLDFNMQECKIIRNALSSLVFEDNEVSKLFKLFDNYIKEHDKPNEEEIVLIKKYFTGLHDIADKYDLCTADLCDYE